MSVFEPATQQAMAQTLKAGGTVSIAPLTPEQSGQLEKFFQTAVGQQALEAHFAQPTPAPVLHDSVHQAAATAGWSKEQMAAFGLGGGGAIGMGSGLVITALKNLEPRCAAILTVGCTVIGMGGGGWFGAGLIKEIDALHDWIRIKGQSADAGG